MGVVISRTNFCTMGAVSDWVNIGDFGRLGAWFLAIAVGIFTISVLEFTSLINVDGSRPPYRSANFAWLRYILGGLMFGVGMSLAGGCVSKNIVRLGGGNLKSLVTLFVAGIFAYLMTKTAFYEVGFYSWIQPLALDLAALGFDGQDIGMLLAGFVPAMSAEGIRLIISLPVVALIVLFILRTRGVAGNHANIVSGIVIGLAATVGWYLSAGPLGVEWVEAAEWADEPPVGVGIQSFTFVNPLGEILTLATAPSSIAILLTVGVVATVGLFVGSLADALISRQFNISWFVSFQDFLSNAIGGGLMGTGGVLALGCTIGQGVSGISTLALGSIITLISIILGCALTLKIQFYRMLYDDATFTNALLSGLVDIKLLPESMRKLESI